MLDFLFTSDAIMALLTLTFLEENASSALSHDTLLHGESLSVVTASDLENVSLVVVTHDFTVNLLAHSSVEERTTVDKR